jgi:hypothetical protein
LKSISRLNKLYTGIAVSMIIIGIVLLVLSFSNVLNPRTNCQDVSGIDHYGPAGCPAVDPMFEIVIPSSTNFILIVLSACLAAFGAMILGIILRL